MARMKITLILLENFTDRLLRKAATIWYQSVQSWSFFIAGFAFAALLWTGIILEVREFQNGNMSEMNYFVLFAYLAMIPGAFICTSGLTIAGTTTLSFLSGLVATMIASCGAMDRNRPLESILVPLLAVPLHFLHWFDQHERIYVELRHLSPLHRNPSN